MAPQLPAEILRIIVKIAIARRPKYSFGPAVPDDYTCAQGFAKASPEFAKIVASLPEDKIFLHSVGPSQLERLEKASSGAVWHIQVHAPLDNHSTNLFEAMSKFSKLTSLSFTMNETASLATNLNMSTFASKIRSLDLRSHTVNWPFSHLELRLPNLLELRVNAAYGRAMPHAPFTEVEENARELGHALRECANLQYVSFHYALDDWPQLHNIIKMHIASIEHLNPSEGYSRHFTECPLCLPLYDRVTPIQKENQATCILAEILPRLSKVAWTDAWSPPDCLLAGDESGQRSISITRQQAETGMETVLEREDRELV